MEILQILKKRKLARFPRLDTVLMVEDFIKKHSGEYGKYQLWKKLKNKVMYQTYLVILDYLLYLNKIVIARDGRIVWIWNPKLVRKYLKRPDLEIKI